MSFNPDQFLQTSIKGKLDTEIIPIPEGEYVAVIQDVKARVAKGQDGKESPVMDVTMNIDNDEVRRVTGLQKPTIRQSVFLDVTDSGALDMAQGRNVQLGRLRDAVNQNTDAEWAASMLIGQTLQVQVKHTMSKDGSGKIFANVTSVMKL